MESQNPVVQSLFVVVSFAFFLLFSFHSQSFLIFLSFFILLVSYFMLFTQHSIEKRVSSLASWTVGVLYCGVFTGVVSLGVKRFGVNYFIALLILSFATDTFAYLGGRLVGKHPLAPLISPKKTLEGSLVGLICGAGIGAFFLTTLPNKSPLFVLLLACVATSLFSQVGDLFESMIKRHSGVKDSGRILPGHGGILDRIDGLLFAGPVIYLWMDFYM